MSKRGGTGQVVLITGASSGIGEAIAWEYAQRGARIVATARRRARLDALVERIEGAGGVALAVEADVTQDGDIERAVEQGTERFGRLDVAVANAGFGVNGRFEKLSIDDYRRQFETNVFGVLRTAYATMDALKLTRGSLAVMGSVMGYFSLPGSSAYAMSKFAARALCETLYAELGEAGISVTHLAPGFVVSEIDRVDNQGRLHEDKKGSAPALLRMPTDRAARQMVDAIQHRRREQIITAHGKAAVTMARHAGGLFAQAGRWMPKRR